jgi:hypothetical protein
MREVAMCLKDLLDLLREQGVVLSEPKLRWAIKTGKVSRPRVDGSLRFDFGPQHVEEICAYFARRSGPQEEHDDEQHRKD